MNNMKDSSEDISAKKLTFLKRGVALGMSPVQFDDLNSKMEQRLINAYGGKQSNANSQKISVNKYTSRVTRNISDISPQIS